MNAHERARQRIERFRETRPDAADLARLASLAVRVETPLLRVLRLELLPHADVGAEADLWFSPLVESRGTDLIVFERHVTDWLRQSLVGDDLLARVIDITQHVHASAPASIRLEEEVNGLALARGEAALPEIDAALKRAIRAMRENDERAREIGRWILRAAPRLHPVVLKSPSAITLVLGASMLLGRRGQGSAVEADVKLDDLGWILPPNVLSDRAGVDIERTITGLRFVAPASGSGQLSLPRTDPLLVEIRWKDPAGAERNVVIDASPGRVFDLPAGTPRVSMLTVAGDEYEVLLETPAMAAPEGASAETTATEPTDIDVPWVDVATVERVADACVRVTSPSHSVTEAVGFWASPFELLTARAPFGGRAVVRVLPGEYELADVFDPADGDDVIAIRPRSGMTTSEPARLASVPVVGQQEAQQAALVTQPQEAVALGYDTRDELRAVRGQAEVIDFTGRAFRVFIETTRPDQLPNFVGGPVVIDGAVRGLVTDVQPAEAGRSVVLSAVGSPVLIDLLQRVTSAERSSAQRARQAQQQAAQEPAGTVPSRARDAVLEVHGLGDNLTPASGVAVDDRRIITATRFGNVPILSVRHGSAYAQARARPPSQISQMLVLQRFEIWTGGPGPRPVELSVLEEPSEDPIFGGGEVFIVGSADGRTFDLRGEAAAAVQDDLDSLYIEVKGVDVPAQVLGAAVFMGSRFAGMIAEIKEADGRAGRASSKVRQSAAVARRESVRLRAVTPYAIRNALGLPESQNAPDTEQSQRRANECNFARVVVLGDPGAGRSALIAAIAGQRYNEETRRAIWWLGGLRNRAIVLHEVLADENWPIAFDLEHAAAAIIAEDVHGGNTMRGWLRRLRAIRPDLPVLFAATKADSMDEDVRSGLLDVESLEREDLKSRGIEPSQIYSTIVSATRGSNIDRLRSGLESRIDWPLQPQLDPQAFERARSRAERVLQPANTILPQNVWESAWRDDAQWLNPIESVIGVRRLPGESIVVEDPRQFESLVTALIRTVRQGGLGVPAMPFAQIEAELTRSITVQDSPPDARQLAASLVSGTIDELLRIREAANVDTDQGAVLVLPRWLGPAPSEPTEPTGAILRARSSDLSLATFTRLAARFAYANQHSLREAGWNAADHLGRIHAFVAGGMPLYIELAAAGPSAELTASISTRVPEDDAYTPTRLLREWLEELMPGNVDIRTEEFRGRSGFSAAT